MGQIAVLTHGLWRLRGEIAALTGMTPVRWYSWPRPSFDAVAGWGRAPTTKAARRLAERSGKPYLAFEDGPLRSVRPGPKQPPLSMVVDRSGIYYDAGSTRIWSGSSRRKRRTPPRFRRGRALRPIS